MSFKFYLRLTLNNVLSILMSICLSFDLLAQTDTLSQNTIVKQKGMYRNFGEFIKNSPSVIYRGTIERREEIINIITPPLAVYKLTFGDEKPCEKNERIWGFCDGQHFYKARNYMFEEKNVYDKIIFVGKYVYYQSTESSYSSTMMMSSAGGGAMMGGSSSKRVLELSIDPDTGYPKEITIELLRKMIVDDNVLIKEFEMQKRKKKMIGSYFLRYLEGQAKKSNP